MIRRLAGDCGAASGAEMARILDASFHSPDQRWSADSIAGTLAVPGTLALLAPDACAVLRMAADEAEILTLAVVPQARRQRRAIRLVDRCVAEAAAAGALRLHLEVAESNAAARALYRAAGFGEVGRRPGYYRGAQGREDAVLMSRATGRPGLGRGGP